MKIHDLTAAILRMPTVETATEAVDLSKYTMSLCHGPEDLPKFLKVSHRELSYTVGHWSGWEGCYWVVEDRTGIIFRYDSLREVRECIKLCSACVYEPNGVKP